MDLCMAMEDLSCGNTRYGMEKKAYTRRFQLGGINVGFWDDVHATIEIRNC